MKWEFHSLLFFPNVNPILLVLLSFRVKKEYYTYCTYCKQKYKKKQFAKKLVTWLTILQNRDGEVWWRVTRQPQSEILVRVVWDQDVFTDFLQFGHPAGC